MDSSKILCSICLEKFSRYTCPRCNTPYCDVVCYKHEKHAECSELFYRDWFVKEIKKRKVSEFEKKAILETIRKVEDENPLIDGFDDEASLENRLQGIDINNAVDDQLDEIWSKLSAAEQKEFEQQARSGFLNFSRDFAQPWAPWWLSHNARLVREATGEASSEISLPQMLKVPAFNVLTSGKQVSPLVGINLINVLYSYVFYQRLFNGCGLDDFFLDFGQLCISSSAVLFENRTFDNADESMCLAMQKCAEVAQEQQFTFGNQFLVECTADVSHVLVGPCPESSSKYVVCVLSDLHASVKFCRKSIKSHEKFFFPSRLGKGAELKKHLFGILKKLEFYISWSAFHLEQLALLAIEVNALYSKKMKRFKEDEELEKAAVDVKKAYLVAANSLRKPLIKVLE